MAARVFINDLPEEVLGTVFFEFVEQESEWEGHYQHPGLLVGVCRLWKVLVEGNPELWSRICVELGRTSAPLDVEPIKYQIHRAKRFPLALDIQGPPGYISSTLTRDVLALYDLVKEHRWRALSILNSGYLSSFQIIFRHMIDNRQMCRLSSFRYKEEITVFNAPSAYALAREALRPNLHITDLAVPRGLLEPSYPLLKVVSYIQLLDGGWSAAKILDYICETPSLQRLRVESIPTIPEEDESISPCRLPRLTHLDLQECDRFPTLLLQKLDLPSIYNFKLKVVYLSTEKAEVQLTTFVLSVLWLAQIRSFTLDVAQASDAPLLWALWRLPLLTELELASEKITCQTTKALSQPLTAGHGWLCPLLEEIKFRSCHRLLESDVAALVKARVRDVSNTARGIITEPNLLSPARLRKVIWESHDMIQETFGSGEMQP